MSGNDQPPMITTLEVQGGQLDGLSKEMKEIAASNIKLALEAKEAQRQQN